MPVAIAAPVERVDYHHSLLCQTSLPYKNPGDAVRKWQRVQGAASLLIEAGSAQDPCGPGFVDLGIPFGEKARLVLIALNGEAVRTGSPEIEVEDSLTAFVASLGLATHGRNIRTIKDPWACLKDQFGVNYGRMTDFRRDFRAVLKAVLAQYPSGKLNMDGRGVTLRQSPPPVPKIVCTSTS